MKKCDAYEEIKQIERLSDYDEGFLRAKQLYYSKGLTKNEEYELSHKLKVIIYGRCNGTRECDRCYCEGDKDNCTFYDEKGNLKDYKYI